MTALQGGCQTAYEVHVTDDKMHMALKDRMMYDNLSLDT